MKEILISMNQEQICQLLEKRKQIITNKKNQKILDSVFTQRILLIRRIIISTSNAWLRVQLTINLTSGN